MRIALAGNPNSGKTTMYNALTGQNEKVGNWAGVTVEKKEHPIKKSLCGTGEELIAVDLPGAYSMSPFTSEESITSAYVKNEHPDAIINIVDATNLSRSLFFTTQLLELGIPVVVALNKADINKKKETKIDAKALSEKLGCPVVETVSSASEGMKEVVAAAVSVIGKGQDAPYVQGDIDLTDKKVVEAADRKRFEFVNKIVKKVEDRKVRTNEKNAQDKLDAILTNKWLGIPIFAVVMFLVFQISQAWLGAWIAEGYVFNEGAENELVIPGLVTLIEAFGESVSVWMENANPLLTSIVVDGIIGGVGAVVGFLPLVMVMYFLIALLEDCGYMARVTVVLDPIFKKVGLSGKSVIPFVIGTGCAIPGVMACRTIRNERERRATAMLAPFMPCGAKLPVISLFAGAFFANSTWVGTAMYFVGILLIFVCALLVNKLTGHKNRKSFFIIELPEYKAPSFGKAFMSMCQRGWSYIVKAGTIILVCNFAVQLMQTFSWSFQPVEDASQSILATISTPFAYFFAPIVGVVAWQLAAAAITGFIAKENVVGTLAVCFVGLENLIDTEELALMEGAGAEVAAIFAITKVAALAYLMFNLFTPPCFAAIGAMNSEIKSRKWLWAGIGLQFAVGYSVGFLVFFFGSLFTGSDMGQVWMSIVGWGFVLAVAVILTVLIVKKNKQLKEEYALKKSAREVAKV
ncbi:MAG: ferrous iron transport protein B [Clostridia bacterium]|nr:ferrous iron transport protein B [Clostridia bacterium]